MSDDTPTPAVRLRDVRLDRGGRTVLDRIDLVAPRGSITAVLGPSGSGKSTLLAALTGELPPASGTVEVLGQPMPTRYLDEARVGDHIWWISNTSKFAQHYPSWKVTYDVPAILGEIYQANRDRWVNEQ